MSDDRAVHMAHCNSGEYEGSCKYGDVDCPAMTTPRTFAEVADEVMEALRDSKRYLTEFGSVEPSSLVWRINNATRAMRESQDEWFYRDQWASANQGRFDRGERLVTYSQFCAGVEE